MLALNQKDLMTEIWIDRVAILIFAAFTAFNSVGLLLHAKKAHKVEKTSNAAQGRKSKENKKVNNPKEVSIQHISPLHIDPHLPTAHQTVAVRSKPLLKKAVTTAFLLEATQRVVTPSAANTAEQKVSFPKKHS